MLKGAKQVEQQNNRPGGQKVVNLVHDQDSGPRMGAGMDDVSEVSPSSLNKYGNSSFCD